MKQILRNGKVFLNNAFVRADVLIENGKIVSFSPEKDDFENSVIIDVDNYFIFPGFTDVHVHLREPGFSYKETIKSGTLAAAHGGYVNVCSMPNLSPVPDSLENLEKQLEIIEKDAVINVYPYGAITVGQAGEQLSDMEEMSDKVIAFSDDGRGVQSDEMMKNAMLRAKALGKMIVAHCEVNELLEGGYIHKGKYAELNSHRGICSESEWKQVERDLKLVRETGCKYHVCHISTKETVELIRQAKAEGLDVSCETGPHYLVFNDMDLEEHARFKMNPPIRDESDRQALVQGIIDGTIDMIATDHAPHSEEEKSKGLEKSLMGVVGLETAFCVMYTEFVKKGIITLEKLVELMSINPAKRFGLDVGLEIGAQADLCVFDLEKTYKVDPTKFLSMGRFTPFDKRDVSSECVVTMVNGNIVYKQGE